jgi:Cupin-like domain/F-box-like
MAPPCVGIPARKRARFDSSVEPRNVTKRINAEEFALLESSHPYGVLPGGNRFLSQREPNSSSASTTENVEPSRGRHPASMLSDEAWFHVLEFCSDQDLGRVVQVCRYLYAAASEPELWRDALLRTLHPSSPAASASTTKVITRSGPSWKDTLIQTLYPERYTGPHRPIPVRGVYSDYLYRLHSCRSFAIPPSWREATQRYRTAVPRVAWQDMTSEKFEQEFERTNRPVVIEGAAKAWRAFDRWRDPSYLLKQTEGQSFRATSGAAALPGQFEMQAYLQYCQFDSLEEAPLYLFDRAALSPSSALWNDCMPDLHRTCPYFDPNREGSGHDLFRVLGEGARPDHTWLIVGPRRSGSVFHIDPNGTHAWNASIVGSKFWIFYPPGVTPPGVHPSRDGDHVALPLSLGEWIFQFWDDHEDRKQTAAPLDRPLECTTREGDVLFVPHGWWHLVVNLDDLNIAVTHNYASESNLSSVLKFLDAKRDQVSGCRDRPDSIKPENLYEAFVSKMKERYPEMTEQALQDPTWACQAWSTNSSDAKHAGSRSKPHKVSSALQKKIRKSGSTKGPCTAGTSVMSVARTGDAAGFSFSFL